MIHVVYVRRGIHVVALTRNDIGDIEIGVAFTQRGALRQLCKDDGEKVVFD